MVLKMQVVFSLVGWLLASAGPGPAVARTIAMATPMEPQAGSWKTWILTSVAVLLSVRSTIVGPETRPRIYRLLCASS